MQHLVQIDEVLLPSGEVQSVRVVEVGDRHRRGPRAQDGPGNAAWKQAGENEGQNRDAQHDDRGLTQPADQEPGHSLSIFRGAAGRYRPAAG